MLYRIILIGTVKWGRNSVMRQLFCSSYSYIIRLPMLPWVNPPQTPENYYPHCCSSSTSGESILPSQMIKGWNPYKFNTEYCSASRATLKLFENIKVTLNVASYKYLYLLCLTFDPAGPFYYKYTVKFVKLEPGYQCLPSDIPACVTSINAHIHDKRLAHRLLLQSHHFLETCSTCQQLISMDFIPGRGWHQHSRWAGRWWWWGRDQWSGMSPPENAAGGVSLSVLWCPSSRTDTIWPAGMLLSRGASGVNAASYADRGMG